MMNRNRAGMIMSTGLVAAAVLGLGAWTAGNGSASPARQAQAANAADVTYKVDNVHSSNTFRIKHMDVAYVYGRFNKMEGSFTLDSDNAIQAVTVTIDVESVDTNNEKRNQHLRGPDFFSAKEFPKATFTSTKVEAGEDGKYMVTGDLTIRGNTKEITAMVEMTGTAEARGSKLAGIEAMFTINRKDFGVDFSGAGGLGEDVNLYVSLEGKGS